MVALHRAEMVWEEGREEEAQDVEPAQVAEGQPDARAAIRKFLSHGLEECGPAGLDFLTVLGAHEGEGLALDAGALGAAGSASPFVGNKGQKVREDVPEGAGGRDGVLRHLMGSAATAGLGSSAGRSLQDQFDGAVATLRTVQRALRASHVVLSNAAAAVAGPPDGDDDGQAARRQLARVRQALQCDTGPNLADLEGLWLAVENRMADTAIGAAW
ncbi:predicted protein [Haematococcus lacustris]|uniref:Uncharacterized protein n=1 Tax=Haematococcus lacustris TaxID=44745 RepID=A0A699YL41_HAELA|nr:predicted protein [Haematococcus lacustris]